MINAALKEINFTSEFDGLEISAAAAVPIGDVYGVVQLVHGMNEYKERYYDFMDYLAEQGFISVIHDNRGHGGSIVTEDDLGFMFKNGGKGFVSDIAQFNRMIRTAYPELPCFMAAHSMGSLGARCFLKEHDDEINGLIILGSPSYSRFSGLIRTINSALSKRRKSRYRSENVSEAAEKLFNKNFGTTPHSWICSRKEVVEEFNENPRSNFIYTLNGYEALLYLLKETYSGKGWQVKNRNLPIRFISGRDDPVMLSEKRFFQAIENLRTAGYESISHRLFDNMRHEVLNEKNNLAVYRDIAKTLFSWIDRLNN
ncbi:MAG: alpha/beta fold hydrolase [Ruminococcus sp.]|nr:alpha/beta fold hydrolase [Ruminococcus sp.]